MRHATGVETSNMSEYMNVILSLPESEKAFLEQLKEKQGSGDPSKIIGQFGVGFYSAFMVSDKVEVYTKSYKKDAESLCWTSDGSGSYEISTAEGVQPGTKIVMHLKPDSREFSDDATIDGVIKKYSNFVGSPIFVNGKRVNTIQALWMSDPKEVTQEQHAEFYRFISNSYDTPRFTLHYSADVPLSIKALLYFPEGKPGLFEMSRDTAPGLALYSRKVLIKSKAENVLPKWLRFIKGVVDSEDIPLNLSRELLQNSALIAKLRNVLTGRILKYLNERATKQPVEYEQFYRDYCMFLKEGIVTSQDSHEKEDIAKLLRFESSAKSDGELVSISDYCTRLANDQKCIYYLAAPNRTLAQQSPYYESFKKRNLEVLFCYEPYDDLILSELREFRNFKILSVEKEMRDDADATKSDSAGLINKEEIDRLMDYMKKVLDKKAFEIKTTTKLESHPCVITVADMSSARQFIRMQSSKISEDMRYTILRPRLEINPHHPIIKKLSQLVTTNEKLATLLTEQLFTSAMVGAGLVEDPRVLLTTMNELLVTALEKH